MIHYLPDMNLCCKYSIYIIFKKNVYLFNIKNCDVIKNNPMLIFPRCVYSHTKIYSGVNMNISSLSNETK